MIKEIVLKACELIKKVWQQRIQLNSKQLREFLTNMGIRKENKSSLFGIFSIIFVVKVAKENAKTRE